MSHTVVRVTVEIEAPSIGFKTATTSERPLDIGMACEEGLDQAATIAKLSVLRAWKGSE